MKKKTNKLSMIYLIICSVLCAALLVTQFIPYWTTEVTYKNDDDVEVIEAQDFSVWDFLSFPENPIQKQVAKYFVKTVGEENYTVNGLAGTAVIIFAFAILTFFFTIFKSNTPWAFIFPLVCGAGGIWGYLTQPVLQLNSLWVLPLVLSALLLAVSLIPAVLFVSGIKRWFTEED